MWAGQLYDGHGKPYAAKVNREGTIGVVIHQHPPRHDEIPVLPNRVNFLSAANSAQMGDAVGSVAAPVDFFVAASNEYDTYIKTISVEITDTNPSARLFGALPKLTNGVQFIWQSQEAGARVLATITSNFELMRFGGVPHHGTGTNAGIIGNAVANNEDSYLVSIDTYNRLGMPWGLPLRKGTTDRIIFRVQDDISALTSMTAIGAGVQVLPED